ncbi:glycosyl transferase family 39 [Thermocrinis albus DSM 14484]|uniref:Glycosyl transferase family 39 n=1 Tax=Thermocrinis albus (strain DSM 14484 / JCM 11386 / HI 11/12) TaxID=638303 RepID=D3SNX8_THEAH|nr:glycosyltransferase family 39 protein [Thermocrinis albus]ADC88865.1 glycosyl transferase family 39 [Thermocrinis albus DSM 14484]
MVRILLLGLFFYVVGNWILSFTSLDEGRNAFVVWYMLVREDYLLPFYNCHLRLEKPPMLYWMALLTSLPFGINEFSLRLVSGLSGIGLLWITYKVGTTFYDRDTALKATVILATLPHMWIETRAFVPEMLFTFFMLSSLYLFLSGRYLMGHLLLSLALLTKGPVALLLVLPLALIWKRDLNILHWRYLLLLFLLGGSWYFLMVYKLGLYYLYRFFVEENIMRFTGQRIIHPYPFYYYLVVLAVAFLFYIPKIPSVVKNIRKNHVFLLLWAGWVIVFFSLAKNKLHHYILFSYPPIALLLANSVSFRYIKRVLFLASALLLMLLFTASVLEKQRFLSKALKVVGKEDVPLYFYRAELSPVPFYLRKCVPTTESTAVDGYVITKETVTNCTLLLEGYEPDGRYRLYRCQSSRER